MEYKDIKQSFDIKTRLKNFQKREINIPGDNNCQFHAITDQLIQNKLLMPDGKIPSYEKVRKVITKWLSLNSDRFVSQGYNLWEITLIGLPENILEKYKIEINKKGWNIYLENMKKNNVLWGDQSTLIAASCIWNNQINVLSNTEDTINLLAKGKKDKWYKTPNDDEILPTSNRLKNPILYLVQYGDYHFSSTTNINNKNWKYYNFLNKKINLKIDNKWKIPKPIGNWN